jgi:acetyl esterase/lipase
MNFRVCVSSCPFGNQPDIRLLQCFPVFESMNLSDPSSSPETVLLWPDQPPSGPGPNGYEMTNASGALSNISRPRMVVHRPENPNGVAILVISGGGYVTVGVANEGRPASLWLKEQGVTAFELVYRLPKEGWGNRDVPFQDAQRALRLIRSRAADFSIQPHLLGVMGFSAGGHLAGTTATLPDADRYAPLDKADTFSARPDFAALLYPVLTLYPPFHKTNTRYILIGDTPSPEQQAAYSVEKSVSARTPKMFLAHSMDDPISPPDNGLIMAAALRQSNVPCELHLFQSCGHGWGMGAPNTPVHIWANLFKAWCVQNKLMS